MDTQTTGKGNLSVKPESNIIKIFIIQDVGNPKKYKKREPNNSVLIDTILRRKLYARQIV